MDLWSLEWWEGASYIVTVVGLPFAIAVFLMEQRRERQNEDEEIFQYLSEEYAEFQKLVLENADLRLNSGNANIAHTEEQDERRLILYEILVSLFERAYLLVYEEKMDRQRARLWASWEDYMRHWCRRADFRAALPSMLEGEDADFAGYMNRIMQDESASAIAVSHDHPSP